MSDKGSVEPIEIPHSPIDGPKKKKKYKAKVFKTTNIPNKKVLNPSISVPQCKL